MQALLALIGKTIQAALRSHVMHVMLALVLLVVIVLPMTVQGEGTAPSQVQVSLTYTLGLVGLLLSLTSIWLGAALLADDIERYTIHMITSKPVSRTTIWLGRWLGIVILQLALLAIGAVLIYSLTMWRIWRADYPPEQMTMLRNEVLVARRVFQPEQPDLDAVARRILEQRLAETGGELPGQINEATALETIRSQLAPKSIAAGEVRGWRFKGLPEVPPDGYFKLRYRFYLDRVREHNQRPTYGVWVVVERSERGEILEVIPFTEHTATTGVFQEIRIRPEAVGEDGMIELAFQNFDPERQTLVWQERDPPVLLFQVTGFLGNYVRAVLLLMLQVSFAAAVGCTAGAALSAPVAIFIAVSYLVLGMLAHSVDMSYLQEVVPPTGILSRLQWEWGDFLRRFSAQSEWYWRITFLMQAFARTIVVSINDFNEAGKLAKGQLIELSQMIVIVLRTWGLRGIPVVLIGVWALNRRELGVVTRR